LIPFRLAYAGVGWAVWRSKDFLPDDILFTVNYLGSPQVSFTLNFSKSGVQVIGQCVFSKFPLLIITDKCLSDYQFLRLGKAGYKAIMENLTTTAMFLYDGIRAIDGKFEMLSAIGEYNVCHLHCLFIIPRPGPKGLPLVAWKLKKQEKYDEFAIARHLRTRGWIVPAYTMAPHVRYSHLEVDFHVDTLPPLMF
jgi:glutamate decarboxylase